MSETPNETTDEALAESSETTDEALAESSATTDEALAESSEGTDGALAESSDGADEPLAESPEDTGETDDEYDGDEYDDDYDGDEYDDDVEYDAVADAEYEPLPIPDELRVNAVVDGVIAKLVDFGAFVDIPTARGTATGLVHVSEVAPGFVENIYAEVGEGDPVRVKVLSIGDDGKIGLSIKQAREDWEDLAELDKPVRSKIDKDFDRKLRKFMHGSQSIQGEARRQKRRKLGR